MVKVAAIKCENYDYGKVKSAVERGIKLIGGLEAFDKPRKKSYLSLIC